jgi:hypothetical protein
LLTVMDVFRNCTTVAVLEFWVTAKHPDKCQLSFFGMLYNCSAACNAVIPQKMHGASIGRTARIPQTLYSCSTECTAAVILDALQCIHISSGAARGRTIAGLPASHSSASRTLTAAGVCWSIGGIERVHPACRQHSQARSTQIMIAAAGHPGN